jgi:hypothetical protein
LDGFLNKLPMDWPYAIEMKHWITDEYFGCLARPGVTHVFQFMGFDAIRERTNGAAGEPHKSKMIAARFLLKPGRKYEEAVKSFQPYEQVKEIYTEARVAGRR